MNYYLIILQGEALRQSLLTRYYGKHSLNRQDSSLSLSLRGTGVREERSSDVMPQRSEMKMQEVQVNNIQYWRSFKFLLFVIPSNYFQTNFRYSTFKIMISSLSTNNMFLGLLLVEFSFNLALKYICTVRYMASRGRFCRTK